MSAASRQADASPVRRYRKRPVVIEAMIFDGGNGWAIVQWTNGAASLDSSGAPRILTLEGEMAVGAGDFVIKGVQGEFYPCKPEIFAATYEQVLS